MSEQRNEVNEIQVFFIDLFFHYIFQKLFVEWQINVKKVMQMIMKSFTIEFLMTNIKANKFGPVSRSSIYFIT